MFSSKSESAHRQALLPRCPETGQQKSGPWWGSIYLKPTRTVAWLTLTDPTHGTTFIEELRIKGCEKVRNGPDLFASNYELALVASQYGQGSKITTLKR